MQTIIHMDQLPTTQMVVDSLRNVLSGEEIDLRDITAIALQDPVIFSNILLLVNQTFSDKNRPVVNSVQAAINLVGLHALKERLLAIKSIDELNLSRHQLHGYNLIRNRIFVSANITSFWADYMGEKCIEEQYCASMFTGLGTLHKTIVSDHNIEYLSDSSYLDSIECLKELYNFEETEVNKLPDSIQQIYSHSSCINRLKLSILTYELISSLEQGYSSPEFNEKLQSIIIFIDQSASRATYDLARQLVQLHRNSQYCSYNHATFLLSTNQDKIDPGSGVH